MYLQCTPSNIFRNIHPLLSPQRPKPNRCHLRPKPVNDVSIMLVWHCSDKPSISDCNTIIGCYASSSPELLETSSLSPLVMICTLSFGITGTIFGLDSAFPHPRVFPLYFIWAHFSSHSATSSFHPSVNFRFAFVCAALATFQASNSTLRACLPCEFSSLLLLPDSPHALPPGQ